MTDLGGGEEQAMMDVSEGGGIGDVELRIFLTTSHLFNLYKFIGK